MKKTLYIFDKVPVSIVSEDEVEREVFFTLKNQNKQLKIFTPNPEIVLKALKDDYFLKIFQKGDIFLPDGVGLRLFFLSIKKRITGVDFMLKICQKAEGLKKSVFLVGGRDKVGFLTATKLKKIHPKLNLVGVLEDQNDVKKVIQAKPDIVFVALGAGKQEEWIVKNAKYISSAKVFLSVGGAFDMISKKKPRAPKIFQKLGIEWFWRLALEPKRFPRVFNAVVVFPVMVILWRVKKLIKRLFF